jgi:putative ABC transport system substrate-binding protein
VIAFAPAKLVRWGVSEMQRREALAILAGAAAYPLVARAQQKAMPVIGFLSVVSPGPYTSFVAAFRQGLSETGYVEGQNVAIEYRWAEGSSDRLPGMVADLVGRKVDVIATGGDTVAARAAERATSTIPIVFAGGGDPVERGLAAGLGRPGSNVTGITLGVELLPKRLELLSELVPQARVIALLVHADSANTERSVQDAQEAARAKGVQLAILKAASESEIDAAFTTLVQLQAGGLVVANDAFFNSRREQLITLASRHAIPAIYGFRFAASGGLISYGVNIAAAYRQAGIYVGKILNGAKPADLPIQRPTTFELVINLNTAKALGLTVPQSLLARADEVIE